jgi:hypothetical protein
VSNNYTHKQMEKYIFLSIFISLYATEKYLYRIEQWNLNQSEINSIVHAKIYKISTAVKEFSDTDMDRRNIHKHNV